MEKIINKYKDENGYIINLEELYKELKDNKINLDDIISIMNKIKLENDIILKRIKIENKNTEKILNNSKNVEFKDYIKEDKIKDERKIVEQTNNYLNVTFYIDFINNSFMDNKFLEILPKVYNTESLDIIDIILVYYLKEIKFLEYNLLYEKDEDSLKYINDELFKNKFIFDSIINYKNNLNYSVEEYSKNKLVYYMDGNIPYVFKGIDDLENIKSILKLLRSIENGSFLNIKAFTSNEKFKGIFEVRDLSKRNRVIFELIGNGQYSIICSIVNKTDSNSKYKENLYNHIKKYKENSFNNKIYDVDSVKKLILGDKNE